MEIVRETIIIPDEKQINVPFYSRELTETEGHGLGIKEFSDLHQLGLSCASLGLKENDYHDIHWFIEIAKKGHLVLQKDENLILYIPPILTKNQYRFLKENRKNIEEYGTKIQAMSLFYENGKFYHDGLNDLIHQYENKQVDILFQELRKKYIPNNNSYVLIIPNEEQLKIENGIYYQEFDSNLLEGHGNIYQIFCLRNQVMLNIPNSGGYFWGKELADKSIMSVIKEDNEIYIFIPKKLSNNQSQWFKEKEEYLMSFDLLEAGVYLEDGSYKEVYQKGPIESRKSKEDLVNEIYEYVNLKKQIMK